jgi:hypothetical protein
MSSSARVPVLEAGWEVDAIAEQDAIRRLREPIGGEYWRAWESTWPEAASAAA